MEFAKQPYSLGSDNHSGVHPKILEAMITANVGHVHAYGLDPISQLAEQEFKRVFGPNVKPEYVFTGTAANVLALQTFLKPYQSVLASDCSHLNTDECAAPEKILGSKIIPIPSQNGKITPEQALKFLNRMGDQHYSQPKAVSLTQPNELGVCYSLKELSEWRDFCHTHKLRLHLDGSRLINAVYVLKTTLKEMVEAAKPSAISFGGTKQGLMGAEAILLFDDDLKQDFKFIRKQGLQLSSKTRFLAAQFLAFLQNNFYLELASHTHSLALDLRDRIKDFTEVQIPYAVESNAVFAIFPKAWIKPLREQFFFYVWDPDQNLCRLMISWDWTKELNQQFVTSLREVKKCYPVA